MEIDTAVRAEDLLPGIDRLWALSAAKLEAIERDAPAHAASPVFTVGGRYTSRGWTEWTQGFRYGSHLLQFDATGAQRFLESGRSSTIEHMPPHVSHVGVHDHGFTTVSTYGNLWRLLAEDRLPGGKRELRRERELYELALRVSGAVQAARWRATATSGGYIYSFNGPQSLFVDTIRSCRALALAHRLGHVLMGEQDCPISLLGRMLEHLQATARWNVYYGQGRDAYDVWGRTAHEALFNVTDGTFRCPSTQQGWSPFTTWTRGLAWAVAGFSEQLEFLDTVPDGELDPFGDRQELLRTFARAAVATADRYLLDTAADGIPYWDTGAPQLHRLGDWRAADADPFNSFEPVDSSAAAIAAQGLLRLGRWLQLHPHASSGLAAGFAAGPDHGGSDRPGADHFGADHAGADHPAPEGARYRQAGLTVASRLLAAPYLSEDPDHQGLLLHSVYHRPNGWDHIAAGQQVPHGESSMWGDYHLRELALYLQREAAGGPYLTFFGRSGGAG